MPDLLIPDVSEFQGVIDWPSFGSDAVIVRINYGNAKVDQYADRNIDGARSRCKAIGWYCYLIGSDDPVVDAGVFCRVLQAHGGLRPNEFVVCDDEEGAGDQSQRVNAFLAECDKQLKATSDWWYSGLNFSIAHNLQAANGRRWIAAYGAGEPTVPHDMWQFTDASSVAGVQGNVDMSVFHGDINQFIQFLNPFFTGGDMASAHRPDNSGTDYFLVMLNGTVSHYLWLSGSSGFGAPEDLGGVLIPHTLSAWWQDAGATLAVLAQSPNGHILKNVWTAAGWSGWIEMGVTGMLLPSASATYVPHKHNITITESGISDTGTPI